MGMLYLSRGVPKIGLKDGRMKKQNVKLLNADGVFCRWLCEAEASRLEQEGRATRCSRLKDPKLVYRLEPDPEPSNSPESPSALNAADIRFLAELRRDRLNPERFDWMHPTAATRIERLIGHEILPASCVVPPGHAQ